MSVKQEDIDFGKAFEKSAGGAPKKSVANKSTVTKEDDDFGKAFETSVKKKDGGVLPTKPSENLPAGDVPGTTSTIPKFDPMGDLLKVVNDYEAKRDKTPEILFKDDDKVKLNGLLTKHNVTPAAPVTKPLSEILPSLPTIGQKPVEAPIVKTPMQVEYDNAVNVENSISQQLGKLRSDRVSRQGQGVNEKSNTEKELENDLAEAEKLKRKAFNELAVNGDKEVVVLSRQDDSGNSFNRTMQDLLGGKPGGWQTNNTQIKDKLAKMPTQFLTGLNILKGTEPVQYERVTENIAKGLPISQSQLANITNLGLNLEQAKLERDILKSPVTKQERQKFDEISKWLETIKPDIDKYEEMIKAKQQLSPDQIQDYKTKIQDYNNTVTRAKPLIEKINTVDESFSKRANEIQKVRKNNLIDNPEVLRAFIADGVGAKLDELGKIGQTGKDIVGSFMLGHTWNYSPEQIKWASEQYLKEQGIDPTIPQAQAAIKFLQTNEGVIIGENSIAKAGGIREFGQGGVEVVEGIGKFLEDMKRPLNDVYAESQSEGNVRVARKRLASEDVGVRGVVNDVLKGTGQFVTQAGIMAATSGAIGTIAEGIMGKAGVQLLADAKAANIKTVIPFDDATANIAAGKFLYGIKDPLSVFTTSYAMAYDGNLKAALSYTSDNEKAKLAAGFNASMEGATELFLSPLEIAEGIIHKFAKNQTKDLLKILSDKSLKNDPSALKEYVGKFVKGVLGTAKVAGAEIGEELVTQISDYVTNMYLNPESESFKNRNLKQELMTTAYQTGLSMALPAVMNGVGSAKANSFSKGSLLVAAQNRQAMIDNLNVDLSQNKISQDEFNQRVQLINTAAVANSQLPKKINGNDLNTNEKANYVWSMVTEAYMDKKMASMNDAAAKDVWKDKILKQQDYRKQILGLKEEQPEPAEYTIDGKPVSREELLKTAEEKPEDHTYVATNDEEAQQIIRNIGGIDDKIDETTEEMPTSDELVKQVEAKAIPGYEKTSINELKEQVLHAPASFKNQFDDEELTVNIIAKNSEEEITNAIKYQEQRLQEPNIDDAATKAIDNHIKLLELGLEKNKQLAKIEETAVELEKEGKPLSKLETLKAKKLLAKEEVPGETVDQKLKHISTQEPGTFSSDITELANKRFPKEKKEVDAFVNRIKSGEKMESPEDLQFYENNKKEIEEKLKQSKPTDVVGSEKKEDVAKEISMALYPGVGNKEYNERGREKVLENPLEEVKIMIDHLENVRIPEQEKNNSSLLENSRNSLEKLKSLKERYLAAQKSENKPIVNEEPKVEVPKPKEKTVIAEAKPDKAVQQEAEKQEPKITDVNLDKEIGLLSAEFLEINKPEVTPGSQRIKIVDIPLSSISTDTSTFQNRETEYSQESVDKILKAVREGNFNWTEFDPITLWKNDGKLIVLSGHSRFEAFKQLTQMGYAGFETIPSEIFEGSKEDARAIALRSNTLSTKETPIERANFYRDSRLAGATSKAILNEAREYEGRNAPTIIALSYLNPNGNAIADLKAFGQVQEGDKSKANSLQMARWVGDVRQQFPQLTNEHENEIYNWLKGGAYSKIKNLAEITARINNIVSGFDFDSEQPLNLEHRATKSYVDEHYEQQLADKEKQIKEQQKLIAEKSAKYNEVLTPQEVAEKLVPDNAILAKMQQDYIKLKEKKGSISEANKGILSLFDNIQNEIDNGNITGKQVEEFINNTEQIEESDPIIEDIERNAQSPDTAPTAIEEGNELIAGKDVAAGRVVKAENKLAEKVTELEKEKTARINEITKPVIDMNTMLINDLFTMAATSEANRQEYGEIKDQFYGLKNLFDCLFA